MTFPPLTFATQTSLQGCSQSQDQPTTMQHGGDDRTSGASDNIWSQSINHGLHMKGHAPDGTTRPVKTGGCFDRSGGVGEDLFKVAPLFD